MRDRRLKGEMQGFAWDALFKRNIGLYIIVKM